MQQDILINIEAGERRVAILRDKKLEWYFVERVSEKRIVGNIYKGVVTSVLNGMGAAFVDFGLGKNGFLYVDDIIPQDVDEDDAEPAPRKKNNRHRHNTRISDIVKKGQEVMVQAEKESLGTKGARLTTHLSLPGRYLVLMPSLGRNGVSRKIKDDKERSRIKSILNEIKLPDGIGLVARTAAEGCDKRDILRDVNYLLDTYNKINKAFKEQQAPALLFEEYDIGLKMIRDFLNKDTVSIMVDEKQEFKRLKAFTQRIAPKYRNRIGFHNANLPLFEKFNIEAEIDRLFERKIFLKCGGYITIEQTEGMIAIDVNSGRFTGKKNLGDTIFKVNREAAEEIARQLRLRDIGGIVIIDFIDMELAAQRKETLSILQEALKKDKARTNIISFSELNVVEMTRQRVRKSLESVSYENCPYCRGKGMVKSDEAMVTLVLRKLKSFIKTNRKKKDIEVCVHPKIASRLVNQDAPAIDNLKRLFRRRVLVVSDETLHIEEINIK
ncbi:MAG: Rne/Rng family ribonuclease [Candidatus Omnitrophota bacterium]|jgi:ribonuclease G